MSAPAFTLWSAACQLVQQVFRIDVRSLALARMALGLILIADSIERLMDCRDFAEGLGLNFTALSQSAFSEDSLLPAISLFGIGSSLTVQYAILGLRILAAGFLVLGFRTTAATFGSFLLNQSAMLNNPFGLNGGDVLLNLLLFLGVFLPLGRAFSLDRLRRPEPGEQSVCNGATAAILLLVGMVYWTNMVAKCAVPAWHLDYTALEYSLRYSQVTRPLGEWLLAYPASLQWFTRIGIALELYVPLLVFLPIALPKMRAVAVPVMIFFHAIAINLLMNVGGFGFVISAAWLLFLPAEAWDWLQGRLPRNWSDAPLARRLAGGGARLAAWLRRHFPLGPNSAPYRRYVNFAASAFCLVWISGLLYLNLGPVFVGKPGRSLEKSIAYCIRNQYLNSSWAMFENPANFRQRWVTVEIELAGGRVETVEGLGLAAGPNYRGRLADLFPNERWRKVYERVRREDKLKQSALRDKCAAYLVRAWCKSNQVPFTEVRTITWISNEAALADTKRERVKQRKMAVNPYYLDKVASGSRWVAVPGGGPVAAAQKIASKTPPAPQVEAPPAPAPEPIKLSELPNDNRGFDFMQLNLAPN